MIDEFILNDDIIIVENRKEALNGEIVVVVIDREETTLKKFYNLGNGYIKLVPANPDYEPMIYEANRVEIQGVLKGIVRSFKGLKKEHCIMKNNLKKSTLGKIHIVRPFQKFMLSF
jgi:repressor LexA